MTASHTARLTALKVAVFILFCCIWTCLSHLMPPHDNTGGKAQNKILHKPKETAQNRAALVSNIVAYSMQGNPHVNMLHTLQDCIVYGAYVSNDLKLGPVTWDIFSIVTKSPSPHNHEDDFLSSIAIIHVCFVYEHKITLDRIRISCIVREQNSPTNQHSCPGRTLITVSSMSTKETHSAMALSCGQRLHANC